MLLPRPLSLVTLADFGRRSSIWLARNSNMEMTLETPCATSVSIGYGAPTAFRAREERQYVNEFEPCANTGVCNIATGATGTAVPGTECWLNVHFELNDSRLHSLENALFPTAFLGSSRYTLPACTRVRHRPAV